MNPQYDGWTSYMSINLRSKVNICVIVKLPLVAVDLEFLYLNNFER